MSLIKRLITLSLGLVAAFYAVRVGVMVPWTSPISSWNDDFSRYDLLLIIVSVVALVGTAIAIWALFDDFATHVQKTYVSAGDILINMTILIVSSLALGMHLKPAGDDPIGWFTAAPFIWQIVMIFALVPTGLLLVNLVIEVLVADGAHEKRVLDNTDPLQAHIQNVGNQMSLLANNLQTHRDAFGRRMETLEARDKDAAESLATITRTLADIAGRLPPPAPHAVPDTATPKTAETKAAA